MKKSYLKYFAKFKFILIMCSTLLFFHCSSSTDDGTTYNYVGPGSEWSISMDSDDSTFTVEEAESEVVVNGTYETLDSGFTLLTVSSATGDDAPSAGDEAVAIDIPGYVFLLKPIGEGSKIISMVSSGECPVEDFSANWMITSTDTDSTFLENCDDDDADNLDAVGTFSYTHSSTSGELPVKYDVCGDTVGDLNYDVGTITCSAGIASVSTDSDISMYMTQSGGMIVNFNNTTSDDNQIIVAFPNDELSELSVLDGDYIGFVVADGDSDSGDTPFIVSMKATLDSTSSQISFDEIDPSTGDIITENDANGDLTISGINDPANGYIKGTYALDSDAGPHEVICIAKDSIYSTGKDVIFCVGENPTDAADMFNLILVSN